MATAVGPGNDGVEIAFAQSRTTLHGAWFLALREWAIDSPRLAAGGDDAVLRGGTAVREIIGTP